MKKTFLSLIIAILSFAAFSESKTFSYGDYSLTSFYPSSVQPGDAVFVRLIFESKNKKRKVRNRPIGGFICR